MKTRTKKTRTEKTRTEKTRTKKTQTKKTRTKVQCMFRDSCRLPSWLCGEGVRRCDYVFDWDHGDVQMEHHIWCEGDQVLYIRWFFCSLADLTSNVGRRCRSSASAWPPRR